MNKVLFRKKKKVICPRWEDNVRIYTHVQLIPESTFYSTITPQEIPLRFSGISCLLTYALTDGRTWSFQYIPLALLKNLFGKGMILILTFTVLPRNDAVLYLLPNIYCHVDIGMIHFYISILFPKGYYKTIVCPKDFN